jgi:ABC-type lipoprotein release transport system permease subunit
MMLKIAFRNIFRQKRRSVLTMLTMLGGFTLSSIAIAWSDGSYSYVIDSFTRNQLGHIQIHAQGYLDRPSLYRTVDDYEAVGSTVAKVKGVASWTPRLYSSALASVGDKSAGVRIIGIDPQRENIATHFDKKVIDGAAFSFSPAHEAILGQGLANVLKARVGDEVVLVSQGADGSIANDLYTVVGIISSGDRISDQSALYLHLADAQELLVLEGRVHEIAVVGEKLKTIDEVAIGIKAALDNPGLVVETWKEFAAAFYRAMKADQQGSWIMVMIIVIVVAAGVLNTALMSVLERTREYGVMRALGTSSAQVFRLIVMEISIMAILSIAIACLISLAVNYALSIHGVTMPHTFTYGGVEFSKMYTEINARSFYIPALAVLVSGILISTIPAAMAAKTAPARAMRVH